MAIVQLDVGKTNLKLILADPDTSEVLRIEKLDNRVDDSGPYRSFQTKHHVQWIEHVLSDFARYAEITDIIPVTHGACMALVGDTDLILPIMDYEDARPKMIAEAWSTLRPAFEQSYSPVLPGGLNAGRQLYWLQTQYPDAFDTAQYILPYPQFWAWLFCGVAASEVTSYGCHTDMWLTQTGDLAPLCSELGWTDKIPPFRTAWEVLGTIKPDWVQKTGLPSSCRVRCGIHDSNASLLPYIAQTDEAFSMVSSGTWAVILSVGARLDTLDENRDCLANTDAFGRPVPCARFMGGREYDVLVFDKASDVRSDLEELKILMDMPRLITPSLVQGVGPYPSSVGGWTQDPDTLDPVRLKTAAGLYLAEMTAVCLKLTRGSGPIYVDGPFAKNRVFIPALEHLTGRHVIAAQGRDGTIDGALALLKL